MRKKFDVKLSKRFLKILDELPHKTVEKITGKLTMLESAPLPTGKNRIKKLTGFTPPLYRLRVGDFGVLYRIRENKVILLTAVDRKELERELNKLLG